MRFAKRPPRWFDLVIVPDGLNYNVRKLAFGPLSPGIDNPTITSTALGSLSDFNTRAVGCGRRGKTQKISQRERGISEQAMPVNNLE